MAIRTKRKYIILDAQAFRDDQSAKTHAQLERKRHRATAAIEVRTFARSVRAGGATISLWVVVVRREHLAGQEYGGGN